MSKKFLVGSIFGVFTVLGLGMMMTTRSAQAQDEPVGSAGRYASVNGLNIYYEVHGEGEPLMLLHGGLGGVVEFAQLIPTLAQHRQVIAVELQGHGRTADIADRPLSFEQMSDDIAALVRELGYEQMDLMGFSLGGGVTLQTAIRHPEVVRRAVLVSTAFKSEGIHPEFAGGMSSMTPEAAAFMLETPMYQFYSSVAPNLDNWGMLVGKLGTLLGTPFDWSEQVPTITVPVLVLAGDSDWVPPSYSAELFRLLGGEVAGGMVPMPRAQLAVLPGANHFNILMQADTITPLVNAFLDAPESQESFTLPPAASTTESP